MHILYEINKAIQDYECLNGVRPASLRITEPALAFIKKEAEAAATFGSQDRAQDTLFGLTYTVIAHRAAFVDFISPLPTRVPDMQLNFPITASWPLPRVE